MRLAMGLAVGDHNLEAGGGVSHWGGHSGTVAGAHSGARSWAVELTQRADFCLQISASSVCSHNYFYKGPSQDALPMRWREAYLVLRCLNLVLEYSVRPRAAS